MNERIKLLRQHLEMTMEEFGAKLGVTKTTISRWEKGERAISEQTVKLLCNEFNVNEDWLRTGTGGDENMFIPDDMLKYVQLGRSAKTPNEFRDFLTQLMASLPSEVCDYLYDEFKRFADGYKKRNS